MNLKFCTDLSSVLCAALLVIGVLVSVHMVAWHPQKEDPEKKKLKKTALSP